MKTNADIRFVTSSQSLFVIAFEEKYLLGLKRFLIKLSAKKEKTKKPEYMPSYSFYSMY